MMWAGSLIVKTAPVPLQQAPLQLLLQQHHPPGRFPLQVLVVCAAGWRLSMLTICPRRPETP